MPKEPKEEITIHCKYDELVDPSSLKPFDRNRNKHSKEQIKHLSKLIKAFGMRSPVVIAKAPWNCIAKGHGTVQALELLKAKVPVVTQDFPDYDTLYAYVQSDNAIQQTYSELDLAGINTDLPQLGPFDIELLGIKDFELEPADKYGDKDADEIPEGRPTNIKLGDLFVLGGHRLLCGDSTDSAQVHRLMNGEKADMVFTDPPYGIDVAGGDGKIGAGRKAKSKTYGDIIGDTTEFDPRFLLDFPGEKFLFGGNYFAHILPRSTHWIVWNKHSRDEHSRANDFSDCELIWTTIKRTSTVQYVHGWSGMFRNGPKKEEYDKVHPAQKPAGLISEILNDYPANLILDPFLGSGSTLIACHKTGRKCFACEIDPHYIDVAIRRWEAFSGEKAYKLNDDGTKTPFSEIGQAK